jgi:nitroimidazol reductase NimA-like FMN-containing flavoprotein (pyridoxamine 5'-phosphate oxidase superfamily)
MSRGPVGGGFRHDGEMTGQSESGERAGPGRRVLSELDEAECYRLLATKTLGRLAVVREGRPEIFPVNYALEETTVTLRTAPGVKLSFGSFAHVAFEVEDIDPATREGWVVEVRGFAEDITDAGDEWSLRARASGPEPWVEGERDHFIAISRGEVSGRRISRPAGIG